MELKREHEPKWAQMIREEYSLNVKIFYPDTYTPYWFIKIWAPGRDVLMSCRLVPDHDHVIQFILQGFYNGHGEVIQ